MTPTPAPAPARLHRRIAVAVAAVTMLGAAPAAAAPVDAAPDDPDRVLVGLRDDVAAPAAAGALRRAGVAVARPPGPAGVLVADVPVGETAAEVAARLDARPDVAWAEPDQRWTVDSTLDDLTDDSYASYLWGADNVGQTIAGVVGTPDVDIDVPDAWAITRGDPSVVVGVIDTGVDIAHPDLAANIWTNPGEVAANGVDDDGNGYVDDVHGWDFANDDNTVYDDASADVHGTHVAGTIAAVAGNGKGVAGVAPNVTIMPLKFIGESGYGYTSDAIAALEYAAAAGVRITNNSWGGGGPSTALSEAIRTLDLLFVAAAGNSNNDNDVSPMYPASYPHDNIVAVASITNQGARSGFSNYGATTVDLGAPGTHVLSTLTGGRYGYLSGTSMAAPHVAATAALVASERSGLNPPAIAAVLLDTAKPLPSMAGITVTGGIVDAGAAMASLRKTAPDAVRHVTAVPGDGRARISWSAPSHDGGSAIVDYRISVSPNGPTVTTSRGAVTIDGLSNGTAYTFSVRARNAIGAGPTSKTAATPLGAAAAPGGLVVATGSRQITVSWAPPSRDGGSAVTGYEIAAAPAGVRARVDATARSVTLTGIPNGSPQEVTVRARTSAGLGAAASLGDVVASQPSPTRLAGADRFATAARIARDGFAGPVDEVFVATGSGFADALAGTASAAAAGAPVLLVSATGVPDAIAEELRRLQPQRIWVLGGGSVVPDTVVDELRALTGATVARRAGPDRYATSAVVSAASFPAGAEVAYLATGTGFADALGAGAAAGREGGPVLLTAPDHVPASVLTELARLAPRRVVVLGGVSALNDAVVAAVEQATGAAVERRGGASRYETSAAVVAAAFDAGVAAVYLATGTQFPDALAGGAAATTVGAPVLLVPSSGPPPAETLDELRRLAPDRVVVLGGTAALSDEVVEAITRAIG